MQCTTGLDYGAGQSRPRGALLAAGLVDELTLTIAPVTLGAGQHLFAGVPSLRLEQIRSRPVSLATHITYRVVR